MSLRLVLIYILFSSCYSGIAQTAIDSAELETVHIYPSSSMRFNSPASINILQEKDFRKQVPFSIVSSVNTVPGVRMEERSPGSYRLSIRGSLLRSPFGVRNIKIYIDEFPITDAGGNTYLSSIDQGSIRRMEIIKGPDGSLFGANTGGVVLINSNFSSADSNCVSLSLQGGSYGTGNENFAWRKQIKKYWFQLDQAHQQSQGYRENTALRRDFIQLRQGWAYSSKASLRMLAFYSDMYYQTPGGLTINEFESNPTKARQPSKILPGAVEQRAAIFNKNTFVGVVHETKISNSVRHVLAVFGNHVDFINPSILNYEVRSENTAGLRTYLELSSRTSSYISYKWTLGTEWQKTYSTIKDFINRSGVKDSAQSADNINARQFFLFTRFTANLTSRWLVEAAVSMNNYALDLRRTYPMPESGFTRKNFQIQMMPRVATSYKFLENLVGRASVSRGYSPPTVAEMRPSNQKIYTNLQPEQGWNYEVGLRTAALQKRMEVEAAVFYYHLNQAIVGRADSAGNQFFANAGTTRQAGVELQVTIHMLKDGDFEWIKNADLFGSLSYYHFTFGKYTVDTSNYSGHPLTGVPSKVIVTNMNLTFPVNLFLFVQYNYTSAISLNDASTVYARAYHLVQARAGWSLKYGSFKEVRLFVGGDNLLNQKYSLGNDINSTIGRYYNTAPARNYYMGVAVKF